MRHFTSVEWVEYGRNTVTMDLRREMEAHLSGACSDCTPFAKLWQMVARIGDRESDFMPPEAAVRQAKGLGSFFLPERYRPAALLVDTWKTAFAGVRSSGALARQIAVESGNYAIDVRIEPLEASEKVRVIGQVLERKDPYGLAYLPVLIKRGQESQAHGCTNRFGEFQFDVAAGSGESKLLINLPDGSWTEVSLEFGKKA
jgi:hypothetical protein